MDDEAAVGFWCYAHFDDEADDGRVRRLAKKIQTEYQILTGQALRIFVDRTDLKWGQEWRERIDSQLQSTTFFFPILSAAFFASEECRREFLEFHNAAKSLGVSEYILAIRYANVDGLNIGNPDVLKDLAARTQYQSWETLRLEDESGTAHRKAVNGLAVQLRDLMEKVEARPAEVPEGAERNSPTGREAASPRTAKDQRDEEPHADGPLELADLRNRPTELDDDPYGDEPSQMELIAAFEPLATEWIQIMQEFLPLTDAFLAPINASGESIAASDKVGNPYAARLTILRKAASELDAPSKAIEEHGQRYIEALLRIDPSVRALLDLANSADLTDPNEADSVAKAKESIIQMAELGRDTRDKVQVAIAATRSLARMSRDLRPALKRYETGAQNIVDGQSVIDEWHRLASDLRAISPTVLRLESRPDQPD